MKIIRLPIILTFVLALTQIASADIVTAEYLFNLNSAAPTSPGDANTLVSPYNAPVVVNNSGITSNSAFVSALYADGGSSFAVHEFTLTPLTPSSAMNFDALSELTFDYQITGNHPLGQFYTVDVSTSVDGHSTSTTVNGDVNGLVIPGMVSMAPLGTQTAPVTFRFTFNDNGLNGITTQHTLDNIRLSFESVPEPSSALLVGFLAVMGLGFRKRD